MGLNINLKSHTAVLCSFKSNNWSHDSGSDLKLQESAETTGDEYIRLHTTGDEYMRVGIVQETTTYECLEARRRLHMSEKRPGDEYIRVHISPDKPGIEFIK